MEDEDVKDVHLLCGRTVSGCGGSRGMQWLRPSGEVTLSASGSEM
jgi:hypothetical protein